jgi:hypothetical protein
MVVRIDHPMLAFEGDVVLKLFDRRFLLEFRMNEDFDDWTPEIENKFHLFMKDGRNSQFLADLQTHKEMTSERWETFGTSHKEAYINETMRTLYDTEVRVYDTLQDLQGDIIPRLFARVTTSSSPSGQPDLLSPNTDIVGILLQYVKGFPLNDLGNRTTEETWQGICDDAIRIVQFIGTRGILNQDVQARNFIVHKAAETHFRVFMIDFAICKFREDFKDQEEWKQWLAEEDGEGTIGRVMESYLEGAFVYHRSRYNKTLSDYFSPDEL